MAMTIENVWIKRVLSVVSLAYTALLAWLSFTVAFYRIEYVSKPMFAFIYVALNLGFLVVMFLARKQVFTSVLAMINLVVYLPLCLLGFGDWLLIIPPAFVLLVMFFANGSSDTVKTVLGTIFLLMYILGALAFFVITTLFLGKVESTVLEKGVSPSGLYRYYTAEVEDNSGGHVEVYVEPNDRDIEIGPLALRAKGYEQKKYNSKTKEPPTVEWREGEVLYINNERCDLKPWEREFTF